jgi:hypothetical protein
MSYLNTMEFYSVTKKNEILSFADNHISKVSQARRPKIACSPSYADYILKTNAVILLDTGHTLRGDSTWEG